TDGNTADVIAKDEAGNESEPAEITGEKDTQAPDENTTTVIVDDIAGDGVLNKAESETDVVITGKVDGEFTEGDVVTVEVNGKTFPGTLDADGSFSVTVPGADLAADTKVTVTVEATDDAGNKGSITIEKEYGVDVNVPDETTTTVTVDDIAEDGVLNKAERSEERRV